MNIQEKPIHKHNIYKNEPILVVFQSWHYFCNAIYDNFLPSGGKYCNGDGLLEPTGDCAAGWYCSGGAYIDKPSPHVNSTTLYSTNYSCPVYALNNTGGICEPGMNSVNDWSCHLVFIMIS